MPIVPGRQRHLAVRHAKDQLAQPCNAYVDFKGRKLRVGRAQNTHIWHAREEVAVLLWFLVLHDNPRAARLQRVFRGPARPNVERDAGVSINDEQIKSKAVHNGRTCKELDANLMHDALRRVHVLFKPGFCS